MKTFLLLLIFVQATYAEVFSLPLTQKEGWVFLEYKKIRPNQFSATSEGLVIAVTNSAAPAIYPLPQPTEVTGLLAAGRVEGRLRVSPAQQGRKKSDDYTVRVGLVVAGDRTLNFAERWVSPDWVKQLYDLAPKKTGISQIHFYNVGTSLDQIGKSREHPLSDLLFETIVAVPDSQGRFRFDQAFSKGVKVLAVWISCDGDDTGSSFRVTLERLDLKVVAPVPRKVGN